MERQSKIKNICNSGSANDFFIPLQALLDEYSVWSNINMIICDPTAVDTGRKNGVVAKLQSQFIQKDLGAYQFIGCQHNIFDLVFFT